MPFFPNKTIELWEYTEETDVDIYGELIRTYTKVGEYPVDFQIKSSNESEETYGEIRTDTYKAYFDITVPLTDSMILKIKDKPDTYEIIGSVIVNDHILHHKKVELQKQRKPTILTSGDDP